MIKIKNNTIEFVFNLQDYPLEALYGTAYVFLDRSYLFFDSKNSKIKVFLKGKKKLSKKNLEQLRDEFLNELLSYTVRIKLTKDNKKIRELVVGQALFASLSGTDDPLGITEPLKEKNRKKKKK